MLFESQQSIHIPTIDVLSYIFSGPSVNSRKPIYVNTEDPSQLLTKEDLRIIVRKLGKGLRTLGKVQDGDRVITYAGSSIMFPAVFLGIICAGGVFTGANPGFTQRELLNQVKDSGAKVILTNVERLPIVLRIAQELGLPRESIILLEDDPAIASRAGHKCMRDLMACGEMDWEKINEQSDLAKRLAVINYSSGTTGLPKGCMISHYNLVSNCDQMLHVDRESAGRELRAGKIAYDEVLCAYVPLYHAMGLISYCLLSIKKQNTTYIMPSFTFPKLLQAISQFKITTLGLVPPVAVQLIKSSQSQSGNIDLSSVRAVTCGAAPLSKDTALQLESLFSSGNIKVKQGWGMSECTCGVTIFGRDQYDPESAGVGFLLPNMKARVVDDDGNDVGYEAQGEALLYGPNVFMGYWKNIEATKNTLNHDGWLRTGDYVTVKQNGIFTVLDRKKEFIKVKGYQVAPSEIESVLLEHEDIADCAVIRVTRGGLECPQAHIVPKRVNLTEAEVLAFMEPKLSSYKRLTGGVIFAESIPKSPSGKILRRLIKDPFTKAAKI